MGKTGPKSTHPSGRGSTTKKGYHRFGIWNPETKSARQVLAHNWIWEQAYGPIPKGYQVHHRDKNKQNNELSNLQLLTPTEHKRIHSGCELRDGIWWKPCNRCKEFKPIDKDNWYISKKGWVQYGWCKKCHIRKVIIEKRERKARQRNG